MDEIDAEEAKLTAEFDMLADRAGLPIPPERRDALFEQFKDLRRMVALLHQPREASAEPANIFQLEAILRSL